MLEKHTMSHEQKIFKNPRTEILELCEEGYGQLAKFPTRPICITNWPNS